MIRMRLVLHLRDQLLAPAGVARHGVDGDPVGGGKDAFIGAIHRIAANMDGLIELSCGALSIHADLAKLSGEMLFLPPDRTYLNYEEMLEKESKQPADR